MLTELLAGLEGSGLAASVRGSTWLYPFINAAHILGIAVLFGAIVPFDLRLMGVWRAIPLDVLARVLVPVSAIGLGFAMSAGFLLFSVKAVAYAGSELFRLKMVLLALGIANALAYQRFEGRFASRPVQIAIGAASLTTWMGVIVLGRLVGYF